MDGKFLTPILIFCLSLLLLSFKWVANIDPQQRPQSYKIFVGAIYHSYGALAT